MHAQLWPANATTQSSALASDWFVFACVGLIVAILVWGLILFSIVRWRRREGDAPPQFRNNYPLEITWTVIPLLLILPLFAYTYRAEAKVDNLSVRPPAVTVNVNGYRWGWRFAYVGGPVIAGAATSPLLGKPGGAPPELVLPLHETTRIVLTSEDVIHSFWVPDFLFKRDAIPGQTSAFDIEPDKLGSYVGHCAAFCGLNHALMSFSVRIVTPAQFARWRKGAQTP